MAEELATLRGNRKVFERYIANLYDEISDLPSHEINEQNDRLKNSVMKCRTKFERKSAELKHLTNKILTLLSDKEYEEELSRSLRDDDTVIDTLTDLDLAIKKLERLEIPQNISSQPNLNQNTLSNSNSRNFYENELQHLEISNHNGSNFVNSRVKVKLPKLKLKPFDEGIINWKPFWDQFSASIHSNNFRKIEKFSYLKTFLNESASGCISGLTLTTKYYDEAVKILEERFDNTQILISTFMQQFVLLPKIKSANDTSGLRKLFDKVENSVRNLKTLSVEPETYGSLLVPLINEKLPNGLKLLIGRQFDSGVWSLSKILDYLKKDIEVKERAYFTKRTWTRTRTFRKSRPRNFRKSGHYT